MPILLPYNETERLVTLHEHAVLDTDAESIYDDIASLAACICGTSMAAVTLIDAERQYFKAAIGLEGSETPREASFCAHTILQQGVMVVPDAQNDRRFANNPQVTGTPNIRFYAGTPLLSAEGLPLGALCVIDQVPRQLAKEQYEALRTLGRQLERQLALRRAALAAAAVSPKTLPFNFQTANPVEIQAVIAAWRNVETQYQEVYQSSHGPEQDAASKDTASRDSQLPLQTSTDSTPAQGGGVSAGLILPESLEWVARGLQARTEALLNGSQMRLLYVDDDGLDRMGVRRILERSDLHTDLREVETYAAALAALEQDEFDCLLLDYSLPDGDGFSLLLEVRALGFSLPVIILTGQGDERLAVESVRAGAADYLPKGDLTPLLLSHSLRSAVRVHQAEQERKAQAQREAAERVALLEQQKRELERALREAEDRADRDPLTGLFNHRVFHLRLAAETARAEREGTTLAVVMLDLDNFKFFNDAYSHATGDDVLRRVANRLREICRPYDIAARFGGDEFSLLLPNVGNLSEAQIEARLLTDMRDITYRLIGQEISVPITVSAGAALFRGNNMDAENGMDRSSLVRLADERLGRAKTGGAAETEADRVRCRLGRSLEGFSMLDALVTAVDNKDRYTRRHSEDVMEYSLMIAQELGLDEQVQQTVGIAALLHDVGKIGVPDAILRKPGKLTDQEFDAVKQHPAMGAVLVGAVTGLEATLDAVHHHHEHWDGGGYPCGLRGSETPLTARLMAVADAFSAMTTDRPYRMGMGDEKALSILAAGAGSQWDPQCVAAFQKAYKKRQPCPAESAGPIWDAAPSKAEEMPDCIGTTAGGV